MTDSSANQSEPSLRSLQRAKRGLKKKFGDCGWFNGVGIAPTKKGLGLRLNVDPDVKLQTGEIPKTYHRIPVEIVLISGYKPRTTSQNCQVQRPKKRDA